MFEISWSELLILAVVTLIFVGPKELPVFLRTLGRYAGSIKRQAAEFRSQFDAAMREAELDTMRKEMEAMQASVNSEIMNATTSVGDAAKATSVVYDAAEPTIGKPVAIPAPEPAAAAPSAEPQPQPPMPAPPRMEP